MYQITGNFSLAPGTRFIASYIPRQASVLVKRSNRNTLDLGVRPFYLLGLKSPAPSKPRPCPDQVAIVLHSNAVPASSAMYIRGRWYPKLVPSLKVHIVIVIEQLLLWQGSRTRRTTQATIVRMAIKQ
ncbi:uncharacterized protein UV8b_01705 [Ustilaginoidea virens]|uniref:Uncharacterized protein n=1 Tax=Ustilaginoidea virens TaxID=1159556 RepID=A0A8E5HL36_USTVR|nr:uncharacterized protein UV8b_01705 [Ustilaginoidea virens]QUC17464.1 hypothetical protein UV8b_01705 [Ustilaginoidea virens]